MNDQRVSISLYIETDQDPADVQLAVLAALSDRYKILNTSVGVSGGDDDPTPDVSFVVCPARGLLRAIVNAPEVAREIAEREGAVVVDWPADADYRGEVTV